MSKQTSSVEPPISQSRSHRLQIHVIGSPPFPNHRNLKGHFSGSRRARRMLTKGIGESLRSTPKQKRQPKLPCCPTDRLADHPNSRLRLIVIRWQLSIQKLSQSSSPPCAATLLAGAGALAAGRRAGAGAGAFGAVADATRGALVVALATAGRGAGAGAAARGAAADARVPPRPR